jgi:hypothetical protein
MEIPYSALRAAMDKFYEGLPRRSITDYSLTLKLFNPCGSTIRYLNKWPIARVRRFFLCEA